MAPLLPSLFPAEVAALVTAAAETWGAGAMPGGLPVAHPPTPEGESDAEEADADGEEDPEAVPDMALAAAVEDLELAEPLHGGLPVVPREVEPETGLAPPTAMEEHEPEFMDVCEEPPAAPCTADQAPGPRHIEALHIEPVGEHGGPPVARTSDEPTPTPVPMIGLCTGQGSEPATHEPGPAASTTERVQATIVVPSGCKFGFLLKQQCYPVQLVVPSPRVPAATAAAADVENMVDHSGSDMDVDGPESHHGHPAGSMQQVRSTLIYCVYFDCSHMPCAVHDIIAEPRCT